MIATHRVKDSSGNTLGFIVNSSYYTYNQIVDNINAVDNLKLLSNGIIRANKELPVISYKEAVNDRVYLKLLRENKFERDIQKDLDTWRKRGSIKVLQIDGARQTGKTTEILKFAYKNYDYVIYLNLAVKSDLQLMQNLVAQGISELKMHSICKFKGLPTYENNKNTILIIDEIQTSPDIYNQIRNLRQNLNCSIIVTGSYLGRILRREDGFFLPAGTLELLTLFPLSFREFCRVFNMETSLMSMNIFGESKEEFDKLYILYSVYRKIGGYPEVVKEYLRTKDIESCYSVLSDMLSIFKMESNTYFNSTNESVIEVFDEVYTRSMYEMCSDNRGSGKNIVEKITDNIKENTKVIVSRKEISRAIIWLKYCGIIGMCNLAVEGDIRDIQANRRMYYIDCGIASLIARRTHISNSALEGMLTETFVFGELHRLCKMRESEKRVCEQEVCFSTFGAYELDFMISSKDKTVYGIEIKTNTGDPKSLRVYLDRHLVDKGIVAKNTPGGHGDKFDTIPIFTVGARFPYR